MIAETKVLRAGALSCFVNGERRALENVREAILNGLSGVLVLEFIKRGIVFVDVNDSFATLGKLPAFSRKRSGGLGEIICASIVNGRWQKWDR